VLLFVFLVFYHEPGTLGGQFPRAELSTEKTFLQQIILRCQGGHGTVRNQA
jgi:hypothetical protein